MRYARHDVRAPEMDMTPMIDMTFQLIAFFMIALNFSAAEQDERIKLPASELALPPEGPADEPLTLQLTDVGTVLFGGQELRIPQLRGALGIERQFLERQDKNPAEATVIIRADAEAPSGQVQELIKLCQETGFERFSLRAKQEDRGPPPSS